MPVDYRMLAETPFIDINAIGNALAVRQHLQDQPMRQMKAAEDLKGEQIRNRINFMAEQQAAAAEKARQANIEELLNLGANGPQAVAGAANIPAPPPAAANAFTGVPGPPAAAPTPQGWRPPMALPPEGQNALAALPPKGMPGDVRPGYGPGTQDLVARQPAARIPYSPEAEGQYKAKEGQRLQAMKEAKDTFSTLLKSAVDTGSQEMVDSLIRAAKKSPALAPMIEFIGDPDGPENQRLRVVGKGEVETESEFSKEQLASLAKNAGSDVVKKAIEDAKPGAYAIKTKGDRVIGFKPATGTTKIKIVGLDPSDNKPVREDHAGNLTKDGVPYTGGQLLPLTETQDQKSFDEQSAFKPTFENKLAEFVKKNDRQPTAFEKNKLTVEAWREVVKAKAEFTAPTILAGTVPGQPGMGITFTGRGGEGKAGTVPFPGGGMTGKEQKPLSEKAQEDLTSSFQGLDILQTLKNTVGESGRVKGLFSKAGAWLGTNEDAVKFNASRQQMWLMAQSAVKGIPSDKDMSMVMNSVPELWEPETVNNERIKVFERIFKNAIAAKISMYKGSNTIMPPEILALARSKGIKVDSVKPWDEVTPFNLMEGIDANSTGGTGVQKMVKKDGKWVPVTEEKK